MARTMARTRRWGRACRTGIFVMVWVLLNQPVDWVWAQANPALNSFSTYEIPLCRYGYITYTVALANPARSAPKMVTIHNPIPANTHYVEGSVSGDAGYNSGANRIEWNGPLAGGEAITVTFVVTVGLTVADGTMIHNSTIAILQERTGGTTTLNAAVTDTVDCTVPAATPPPWEMLPPNVKVDVADAASTPEMLLSVPGVETEPFYLFTTPYTVEDESPPGWTVEMFLPMLRTTNTLQATDEQQATPDAAQQGEPKRRNPCTLAPPWRTSIQMDETLYVEDSEKLAAGGFRPISITANGTGDDARFSTIWVKDGQYADNWILRHRLTANEYQQSFEDFGADGFVPVVIDAYGAPSDPRYAAIWIKAAKDERGAHGVSRETMLDLMETNRNEGYRPLWFTGLSNGDDTQFSALWVRDAFTGTAGIDLTKDDLSARGLAQTLTDAGYRLQQISGYDTPDGRRYAATWVLDGDCPERRWESFYDQAINPYVFKAMAQVPIQAERVVNGGIVTIKASDFPGRRYTRLSLTHGLGFGAVAILRELREEVAGTIFQDGDIVILSVRPTLKVRAEEGSFGNLRLRPWQEEYTGPGQSFLMDNHQYRLILQYDASTQKWVEMQRNDLSPDYYYPISLDESGEIDHRDYASVWLAGPTNRKWQPTPLQTAPLPGPDPLADFDDAMFSHMQRRGITYGSLAVTKDGKLVFAKAYTWDHPLAFPVNPMQPFRVASVSKSLTAVGVLRLVQDGAISLNQKLKDIPGFDAAVLKSNLWIDARIKEVTVGQLLYHTGGWDRDISFDPMTADFDTCAGLPPHVLPTTAQGIIDWMHSVKLDHKPGWDYAYSNFGYNLLGRVIEVVTGQSYDDYMQETIFDPLGMNSAGLTNNLSTEPLPSEVFYHTPNNSIDPSHLGWTGVFADREMCNWQHADIVPAPYGGLNLLPMDSHGGWAVSAPDLARFLVEMESPTGVINLTYRNLMWSRQEGRSVRVSLLKSLTDITDYTIAARTKSSPTFPAPTAKGEWLIVAKGLSRFSSVNVTLAKPGSGYKLRFLYSAAGITKEFDPEAHNLVDGTDSFQQDGVISFTPPDDWQPQTFGGFDGKPRYFIAILADEDPTVDAEIESVVVSPGEVDYGLGWGTTEDAIVLPVAFGLGVYPVGKTVVGTLSKAQANVVGTIPWLIPLPGAAQIVMDSLVGGPFIPGENLFIDNIYVGKALGRDTARTASANHGGLLWGTRTWIVHRNDGINYVVLFNQDNHGAYYLPNEERIRGAIEDVIDDINSTNSWPNVDLFP